MKKLFTLFAAAALIFVGGCSKEYDDSALNGRVDNLENRVAKLEELCRQMNTNISSLQTIVTALQNNDYVTGVTPVTENGQQIGYTLTFAKSGPIVIYHGQNGKDGANGSDGQDGVDGTDGKDGHTPVIGVRQDADGIYYWTLDGEWLLDSDGNKIKAEGRDGQNGADGQPGQDGQPGADGQDGITPQLKIEGDYWYISYDNGASWTQLGKATGENGADGANDEVFFQNVTQDENYVYLTLSEGERIAVPKHHPLSIAFDKTEDILVLANQTYSIGYTLTGADDQTVVKALAQDGFRAVVKKTDNATGTIEITTPATILSSEVLVFVSDGEERTIMRSINFVEGVILITTKSYTVGNAGGTVKVDLSTNLDYTVEIPEADQAWISVAKIESRAMRDETITLNVAANSTPAARYSEIRLVDALGVTGETILITQEAGTTADDPDIVHFPDELFKAYMVARFDKNKDGEISKYEASLITRIECQSQYIQSLKGIEYCTALIKLFCTDNQLTTLDVSKNTALTVLYCDNNRLTALDVSNNTALESLRCGYNPLEVLNLGEVNPSLDYDGDVSIHLAVSTKLKVIGTKLTKLNVSGDKLQFLDISECLALTYLSYQTSQLTTLDISKNTALVELYCAGSRLKTLDVSNNTRLETLYCGGNPLITLDVSSNTALTYLNCENCQLTTLDVSNNTALTDLRCNKNQLTALDVSNNTAITYLRCNENQLTTLDVSKTNIENSTSAYPLDCSDMPDLQTLYLKTGWKIRGINEDRSISLIPEQTEIRYKD